MLVAVGFGNNHRTEAAQLSLGDRKRLELAVTLALEPVVLMLDEPTAGVDVELRRGMWNLVRGLSASGETVMPWPKPMVAVSTCPQWLGKAG